MLSFYVCVLFSVELGNAKSVRNIESSLVFKYYPGLEDALYVYYGTRSSRTHEGESGIRQPDKIFITLSNSAHKHRSLSELGKRISDTVYCNTSQCCDSRISHRSHSASVHSKEEASCQTT